MKEKNKGFTLVELLAVIVILALIALIATPIILNVINDAKKQAAKDSAYGYMDAVEKYIVSSELEDKSIQDGTYRVEELNKKISVKGSTPDNGNIEIKNRIRINTYDILELAYLANETKSIEEKNKLLSQIIAKIKIIDFLLNLSYDKMLINSKKYVKLGEKIDDIIKYVVGWKNSINQEKRA